MGKQTLNAGGTAMFKAKVNEDNQITLPRQVLMRYHIKPGDEVEFRSEGGKLTFRKVVKPGKEELTDFSEWRGYLKHLEGKDTDELIREMRGG